MITINTLLDDEKELAIKFLKKMFDNKNNLNLSEIRKGLDLDFISRHINDIKLNDIFENQIKNFKNDVIDINNKQINLNKLILEIIQDNKNRINTSQIKENINNNMNLKLPTYTIYNNLKRLEKNGLIYSCNIKNKTYWYITK